MATSFVDALLQVRDQYGEQLSGGKIHTYEAGTTTPLDTFQDLEGLVANTNPVILDTAGMATIRQTDGVAYKWIVYDADDNLLFTRDDIIAGEAAGSSATTYLVHLSFSGTPGAQAEMTRHVFLDDVQFPVDFEGSQGSVGTEPTGDYAISIQLNDVEIGTATIAATGVWTFATTSHVTVDVTSGDVFTFIAPDSGSAADFGATLEGELQ